MDRVQVLNKLAHVFKTVFENEAMEVDETLTPEDVENWDSLTHMMLIEAIEVEFGIRFKLSDLKSLNNVKNIVTTIISYLWLDEAFEVY